MSGVRSARALVQFARTLVFAEFVNSAMFLPLGFLSVLAFPTCEKWSARVLRVGLPTLGVALLLVVLINCLRSPNFAVPNSLALLLPSLGCLVGWWAALAWRRGRLARLLFFPQLLLLVALCGVLGVALLWRAVDDAPLQMQVPKVTSADKRRLYSWFSGKNPLKLEVGRTVEVSLTAQDINLLLAWGLPLSDTARSATVTLEAGRGHLLATTQIPGTSKFLNVAAQGRLGFSAGQLQLQPEQLCLGRLAVPTALLGGMVPSIAKLIIEDERVKPMVAAVRSIELTDGAVTVRYGYGRPPKGFIASLFHEEGSAPIAIEGVRAQLLNLLASSGSITGTSDDRFARAVQTAFRYAREHSTESTVAANRSAILALGITLGHPRVESLIGSSLDEDARTTLRDRFSGTHCGLVTTGPNTSS